MLPQNLTNEYGDDAGVVCAETEVIDGVTYQVVYLDGDFDRNKAKIEACNKNTQGNYRYVMTADFDMTPDAAHLRRTIDVYGNAVILDLNGYALTTTGFSYFNNNLASSYFVPRCRTFELTDSSAAQTGRVASAERNHYLLVAVDVTEKIIISGGGGTFGMNTSLQKHEPTDIEIVITGGQYDTVYFRSDDLQEEKVRPVLAPWVVGTYNADGRITSAMSCAYFAVSPSTLYAGAYNYAYGSLAWELRVKELQKLTIPADRTYYLWGRNRDGGYQYLGLRYVNGAWQ